MNAVINKAKGLLQSAGALVKKLGKRNIAIVCAVVMIGCAIWLNYRLFQGPASTVGTLYYQGQNSEQAGNTDGNGSADAGASDDYFAATVITRQKSRDEALAVLQTIVSKEGALPESVNDAIAEMNQIARDMENESNIETLVKAKGFAECVAVISAGKCSVIVKSDGLLPNEVAQIQEIVYEQTGILPENVKMVEKSA